MRCAYGVFFVTGTSLKVLSAKKVKVSELGSTIVWNEKNHNCKNCCEIFRLSKVARAEIQAF